MTYSYINCNLFSKSPTNLTHLTVSPNRQDISGIQLTEAYEGVAFFPNGGLQNVQRITILA